MQQIRTLSLSIDGNPIYYRAGTSDKEAIGDVLFKEEYGVVDRDLRSPGLIVDCGAYAGYSSLYFLHKYPGAHVIAIEPDDANFELCRLNLEAYNGRVTLVHAAVWPEAVGLVLHPGELADGREWATMVKPPAKNETPDVKGVTLGELLRDSGFEKIDLVKMNIECSEVAVFSRNYAAWLPHVRNMVVQLHDKTAEDVFFQAMSERAFLMTRFPTIFVFAAIAPKAAPKQIAPTRLEAVNELSNGGFEELRVAPAQIVPGGWIAGSTDIALDWHAVVCDPAFHVSLAVRTGRQRSGENALLIRMNPDEVIEPKSSPYAAIENKHTLRVHEGEQWRLRAFVAAHKTQETAVEVVTGAYLFVRLLYDDGSTDDLPTPPLLESTDGYVERGGVVVIPPSPPGRKLKHATLWLYVWIVNPEPAETPAASFGLWEVFFDDISFART